MPNNIKVWDTVSVPDGANNIFVFGSNTQGRHGKGAALTAKRLFAAKYGQPEGLQGRAYGIITKDISKGNRLRSISLMQIRKGIRKFYEFARENRHLNFYVTRIGCGLAGYSEEEIQIQFQANADLYSDNIYLPKSFI